MNKKKTRAWLLLSTYLMVILASGSSSYLFNNSQKPKHFHAHESFEHVHHDHTFHIGVFHFLGHVVEIILSLEKTNDSHVAVSSSPVHEEKFVPDMFSDALNSGIGPFCFQAFGVLANPPPDDWLIPYNLQCPFSPLRGPPSAV